jgi:HEAT repeat protein
MRPRYSDLFRRLGDTDPHQVDKAFDAILFDRENAVPDLVEGYARGKHNDDVRYLLVQLLGFSESADATPAVQQALEDPSPRVRAEACRSLCDLRARQAMPFLRRRLQDMDAEVRSAAVDAISVLSRN